MIENLQACERANEEIYDDNKIYTNANLEMVLPTITTMSDLNRTTVMTQQSDVHENSRN